MKVMVTGAAGYIGQPLTETLHAQGHEVIGVDIRPAQHTTEGDIRDMPDHLFEGVDSIVHLAGVSFAPEWTDADDIIWDANVEGVRRVLDQAEQAGVRRFVLASSASIFEGQSDEHARVDTRPRPVSAYGRSKACAERVVAASAIPQKVALRKGTLCGLGPNPRLDLVLNQMSMNAVRKGKVFVDGTGENHRPMLRLSRTVRNYSHFATTEVPEGSHFFNICDDNVTVVGIAKGVCQLTGAELVHREYTGRPRSYVMRNEATEGLPLPDEEPIGIDGMVAEVVAEMQSEIGRLPQVSTDPRLDRLEEINRDLR